MKKKQTGIVSGLVLVVLLVFQFFVNDKPNDQKPTATSTLQTEQLSNSNETITNDTQIPDFQKLTAATAKKDISQVDLTNPPRFVKLTVENIRSVDGDTFVFYSKNKEYRLRMLMVDTPESVKKGMPVQPYGKEASDYTKAQLKKGNISIAFDSGDVKDQYDRYLGYVFVDNRSLQLDLLTKGLGVVRYINEGGSTYQKDFVAAQDQGEKEKVGAWSKSNYIKKTNRYTYFDYNN